MQKGRRHSAPLLCDQCQQKASGMASNFSANQYENAFRSHKLQNWTIPKQFKERPTVADGHTTFIATDRGHLLPGVKRGAHLSTFVGTWDLPRQLAPSHINPMARSLDGQERLRCWSTNQRCNRRASLKKSAQEAPKSPENAANDTLTSPTEGQEIPEALPQLEAPPTSPRPVSQPRAASADHQEEVQPNAADNLSPEVN
ncbi:protein Flattop isoform X1 [Anguilla anguilla]|uniref:protein Flattop isoform X1 n=1 Tax=Anguilla anguilla TaxID=7936 RepID=UPI0015A8C591|nr:protein Flattop isoform X1 [Anguilla anguilla]